MEVEHELVKGFIIAEPVFYKDLEEGAVVIIEKDDKYHQVTLTFINRANNWVVEGSYSGEIADDQFTYRLKCATLEKVYSIVTKDCAKIIKAGLIGDTEHHEFKIVPYKFKVGSSYNTCTICNSNFTAAQTQPLCKVCCIEHSVAHLVTSKKVKKKKEPIAMEDVIQLCFKAFTKGQLQTHPETFEEWLTKQLKKWQ